MSAPIANYTLHASPAPNYLALALALSLGAALSLGITRFAYGLLLSPMRADLGWSYTLAGAMNTINAVGYLLGALVTPRLLKRFDAGRVLMVGAVLASVFMGLSGFFTAAPLLLVQRLLAGFASALVFVSGGLMAARLGALQPQRSGFLIGLYYGGTGFGIVLSALLVPAVLDAAHAIPHGWAWAWWALAVASAGVTAVLLWPAQTLTRLTALAAQTADTAHTPLPTATATAVTRTVLDTAPGHFTWRPFAFALAGYTLFGTGYIGYMTFVIALLREQGASGAAITVFYALLGLAVLVSPRIWAGMLDKYKGGQVLALLCALLGVATVLPALTSAWPAVLLSGVMFGGVFLSLVASTTALVRHNLPQPAWGAGISAFTTVFAAGQIAGPTIVGWIADGTGGLARGLVFSAFALWAGAALAWRQKALAG